MNAVISGGSGMALLVNAGSFHSFHLNSPETRRARQPEEYELLFGGDPSVEFLENVTEEEVLSRLRDAVEHERATRFMLLLLDGVWPTDARVEAAKKLEDMLDVEKGRHIKDLLFALPLPPGESVQSALLLCSGPRVKALLAELVMSQEAIAETRAAWDAAVMQFPASEPDLLHARALAVRSGLFREMVEFTLQRARFDEIQVHARATDFKEIPGWDALLNSWAAPMQARWQVTGEIVAATWGHLRHLHLPRPRNPLPGMAPAMQWPRAELVAPGLDEPGWAAATALSPGSPDQARREQVEQTHVVQRDEEGVTAAPPHAAYWAPRSQVGQPNATTDIAVSELARILRMPALSYGFFLLAFGSLLVMALLSRVIALSVEDQQLVRLGGILTMLVVLALRGVIHSNASYDLSKFAQTGELWVLPSIASVSQVLRAQVNEFNAKIDATADEVRRIRRWRNVPYSLYLILSVGSLLVWYVSPHVVAFAVEAQWLLVRIAMIASAIAVFQLLNDVYGASPELLRRALAQTFQSQADREEATLALGVALSPAGPARKASASGAGWLHVRIPEIDAFADRSVDIIVDGRAQRYEGTNSVVLQLATGSHALEFAGRSNAGDEVRKKKIFIADSGTVREATLKILAGGPRQADDIVFSM